MKQANYNAGPSLASAPVVTRPVHHSHEQLSQAYSTLRAASDAKSTSSTSFQDAGVSQSVPNGDGVPNRNFNDELAAMLDDSLPSQSQTNTTVSSGQPDPSVQDFQGEQPWPVVDTQTSMPPLPLKDDSIGVPKEARVSEHDSIKTDLTNPPLALRQASVKSSEIGTTFSIGRRARPVEPDAKQRAGTKDALLSKSFTGLENLSSLKLSDDNSSAAIAPQMPTEPLVLNLPQALQDNSSNLDAPPPATTAVRLPVVYAQNPITPDSRPDQSIDTPTPTQPTILPQPPTPVAADKASVTFEAFTLQLNQKSSASDSLTSAATISKASPQQDPRPNNSSVTQPEVSMSSRVHSDQQGALPSALASANASLPVVAEVQPQPIALKTSVSQRTALFPKHSTEKLGNTETPLAEKVEPQETEMMEESPISSSSIASSSVIAKSRLTEATTSGQLLASASDKRKQDESNSDDAHSNAPMPTDLRGETSVESRPAQIKTPIVEKDQSFVPVRPNGTQDQVAGGSVKQIVLKVDNGSGQSVSVRLTERGSQVSLGVKSSDPVIAATLKQELPSLVQTLDRVGWRIDGSTPNHAAREIAQTTSSQQSTDDQQSQGNSTLEWDYEQQGRKRHTAELWEEVLNRQSSY